MADLALAEKSKGELVESIERSRKRDRLARLAAKAKRPVKEGLFGSIIAGAGGAAAGVLVAKYPNIRGSVVNGADVAAILAIGGGLAVEGDLADQAVGFGHALLAGDAAIRTYQHWSKK